MSQSHAIFPQDKGTYSPFGWDAKNFGKVLREVSSVISMFVEGRLDLFNLIV